MNKRQRKKWLKNYGPLFAEVVTDALFNCLKNLVYKQMKGDFTEEGFATGGFVGPSPLCEIGPIMKTGEIAGEYIRNIKEAH